jgi:hypothetical protein
MAGVFSGEKTGMQFVLNISEHDDARACLTINIIKSFLRGRFLWGYRATFSR